jgi:hypothetical protein
MLCHPEALLLREGSPAMFMTYLPIGRLLHNALCRSWLRAEKVQSNSDALPEILRATEALQDDNS